MTTVSAAKALLDADATLLTTATGGIWDFDETGRLGLSRTLTTAAYDSNGILKPCVLLKTRSTIGDYTLADDATQYVSVREVLEVWFYQDTGFSSIETMRDRVYLLLHAKQLTDTFICLWQNDIRGQRDIELDANVERSDFLVRRAKSA